jgi:type IV pilus assembly protein PilB
VELKSIKNIKSFADATFYKGKGCKKCNNEGYKSRIGIYEVLEVSEKIQKAISRNATAQEIENEAKDEGMFVMLIDGLIKSLQGITTIEEVLRVTKE